MVQVCYNRWQQNLTAGTGPAPSYSFNANNQSPSFTYDAAGNIINDGNHTYTYDAEGRMLTVDSGSTATYTYDAEGKRVEETIGGGAPTDFIYDQQGHMVTEATANNWVRSELYAGGSHVALYANGASGTTYFMHTDWLGSTKNQSDMSGNSAQTCTYLPFGDGFSCPGPQLSLMSFTGDQWDGETGFSHTQFRQYSPTQGRWMTPDPGGLGVVDPTNPQSWNRYAYVMNNPLNFIDFVGLECYASDQFGNCTNWGTGGNLALLGGFGDPINLLLTAYTPTALLGYVQHDEAGNTIDMGYQAYYGNWDMLAFAVSGFGNFGPYVSPGVQAGVDVVKQVLSQKNSCSDYFNDMALNFSGTPSIMDVLNNTSFRVIGGEPSTVGAESSEGSAQNSPLVVINPNGPFFISMPGTTIYSIGPYVGGTSQAQAIILLHELAHTIDAIPSDATSVRQSVENTNTILQNCHL